MYSPFEGIAVHGEPPGFDTAADADAKIQIFGDAAEHRIGRYVRPRFADTLSIVSKSHLRGIGRSSAENIYTHTLVSNSSCRKLGGDFALQLGLVGEGTRQLETPTSVFY